MIVVGLRDDCTEPFTHYGPFANPAAAREWVEEKHGGTYAIRGDYEIATILSPRLSSEQEAKAYGVQR